MKKLFLYIIGFAALGITSCKKHVIKQTSESATGARIKLINAAPGLPAVDFYVNNVKINPNFTSAVTDDSKSTSISTGISYSSTYNAQIYGGLFPTNDYALVTPTSAAAIKVTASTPTPALVSAQTVVSGTNLINLTQNLEDNKSYSVFVAGFPDKAEGIITEDKFPTAAAGVAYVRIANLIPNATSAFDIVATYTPTNGTATSATILKNIPYKTVSDFVAVPLNMYNTTPYSFQIQLTSTTTKLGAASSSFSLTPGRYYTIIAKGLAANYTVPGTNILLRSTARPNDNVNNKIPEIYFNPPGISYYVNK